MEKIKLAGKTVMIYNSIDELPYRRFVEFNKYVGIDSGTGSNIEEFDQRMIKAYAKQNIAISELESAYSEKDIQKIKESNTGQ